MRRGTAYAAALLLAALALCACVPLTPPPEQSPGVQSPRPQNSLPSPPRATIGPQPPPGADDPPPEPPPEPARYQLRKVELTLVNSDAGRLLGTRAVTRPGAVVIGTDQFTLHAHLSPAPPEEWLRDQVRIDGAAAYPLRPDLLAKGVLELTFPPGPAGQEIVVSLSSVDSPLGTPEGVTLRLRRTPEPQVALDVAAGAGWYEITPWDTIPPGAADLRLRFSKAMNQESVEAALLPVLEAVGGSISWPDPATLLWSAPAMPPLLELDLRNVRDQDDLWLAGDLPVVRSGQGPRLVALDPATGLGTRVADLPPEMFDAALSPDSRSLLLRAYERRAGTEYAPAVVWVVDLVDGGRRQLDAFGTWVWLSGNRLWRLAPEEERWEIVTRDGAATPGGQSPPLRAPAPAPFGDWLAGVVFGDEQENPPGYLYPAELVLLPLAGGEPVRLQDFVHIFSPPQDWRTRLSLGWAPDSPRLATLGDTPEGAELVVADSVLGLPRAQVRPLPELPYGSIFETHWSPTGAHILAGPLILDAVTLATLGRLPAAGGGEAVRNAAWSPDGQWVMYTDQWDDWGPVFAYHLATGNLVRLGSGWPAGWDAGGRALVIQWPWAEYRYSSPHG